MGRSYKTAIMIGLAFVLALSFISVLPATEVQASSPHHGMYNGGHYMHGMGHAYYSGPLPEKVIREEQEKVTCAKWYYQRVGHSYKRVDVPCRYGTAEYDYYRSYRKALVQAQN